MGGSVSSCSPEDNEGKVTLGARTGKRRPRLPIPEQEDSMNIRALWQTSALLTLVTLTASGCDQSTPTSPLVDVTTASQSRDETAKMNGDAATLDETGEALPFQLSGDAVFAGQDLAPGFGPPEFGKSDFGGRCSAPSDFVVRFSVAGQATHMGDVTASLEHCSLVDFETGRTFSESDGEMTLTAANGDELRARYQRLPGESEQVEFIGGTGRFSDASGEATMWAQCDRVAGTCIMGMDGVLAYDASDGSE